MTWVWLGPSGCLGMTRTGAVGLEVYCNMLVIKRLAAAEIVWVLKMRVITFGPMLYVTPRLNETKDQRINS